MKKTFLFLLFVASFTLVNHDAFAQEITITLQPGWNWISYTNAEAMDIASALDDFVPMEGDIIKSQLSSSTYVNGLWRGSVTHFMPGLGYLYYSARSEIVGFVFAHAASSSVTTATPTDITATSVVVGGTVNLPEGSHVFQRGVCWGTEPNPSLDGNHTSNGTDVGSFSSTLEGLNHNTTFYVRAYAATVQGLAYGEQMTFTTLEITLPSVTTLYPSNIAATSATFKGQVTSDGNGNVTIRGICWNTTGYPTRYGDSHVDCGAGTGSFSKSITGLTPGTTYYVRAYALNEAGHIYGSQITFTTKTKPTVESISVYDISPTAAFCGGNVTNNGQGNVSARGVCWSTSGTPTINDNKTVSGSGTGSFYSMIGGLTPNTTYYVRAYATNQYGTGYGATQTFTTIEPFESNVGIVAHRGIYRFLDPLGNPVRLPGSAENSCASVRNAISYDFDCVEFDVQITSDDQLIVFHDFKMSGNNNFIYNLTYATLQSLPGFDLGEGQTVPTLDQLLYQCVERLENQEQRLGYRHTKLVLEVKTRTGSNGMPEAKIDTLVNSIIQKIQSWGLEDDVNFVSFNMDVCQTLKERMPNVPVAYISSRGADANNTSPTYSPQVLFDEFGITQFSYEYVIFQNDSTNHYHPEWVEQAHNLGMTVHAWTIDNEPVTNEMRNLGVDFITTNCPLNMRAWMASEP